MDILGVIPARGGSKGIKDKNITLLNGKPLIEYAISTAKCISSINKLIVSTDDESVSAIVRELGVDVPFKRPKELGQDHTSLIAVNQHAFQFFKDKGILFDAVLSLQPTNPFVRAETIEKAINLFITTHCDSVTTVSEIRTGHPYIAKKLLEGNKIGDFCEIPPDEPVAPRQKRRKAYYLTGGLYLRNNRLLQCSEAEGHCLGKDARCVVVKEIEGVDINYEIDLRFAEFLIRSGYVE